MQEISYTSFHKGEENVLQYELEYANLTEEERVMSIHGFDFSTVGIRVLMDRRAMYFTMNIFAPTALLVFVSFVRLTRNF